MAVNSKIACILLICVGIKFDVVDAESRVGPASIAQKTSKPDPLPVQQYAVIDLSGPIPPLIDPDNPDGPPLEALTSMALDDENNAAFMLKDESIAFTCTFRNGVLSEPSIFTLDQTTADGEISVHSYYYPHFVFTNGTIAGEAYKLQTDYSTGDPKTSTLAFAFFFDGSVESDIGTPYPYKIAYAGTVEAGGLYWVSPSGNKYANQFAYNGVYQSDGTVSKTAYTTAAIMLPTTDKTVFFDAFAPPFLVDTATERYIRHNTCPVELSDTGWAFLVNGTGNSIWDGQNEITSGILPGYWCYSFNNQGWCLMNDHDGDGTDGMLWHSGTGTKFTDLLKGGAWEHQVSQVQPYVLSNQNITNGSMYAVTSLQDGEQNEQVIWKATSPKFGTDGLSGSLKWQPYTMQFPDGWTIPNYRIFAINSSGVIAAAAYTETGEGHALLLVPIGLRLLNGHTSDFDGTIITSLIEAPENPNYTYELGQQPLLVSDGHYKQDPTLGAKTPGSGRKDVYGVIYDLMVAAKAPLIPWLHYRWKRDVFDYEWLITKKNNPPHWEVFERVIDGPHPDANDSFSNDVPSVKRNEFYNYDNTGINYDPSTGGDPTVVYDSLLTAGDFRYCEKVFSYKVAYSIYIGNSPPDNAEWIDGVEMFCSQKILVQQLRKSNFITQAWKVCSHTFIEGKINPRINVEKVRQIVGGNLPITLLPDATLFNQVDPPDIVQVDTSN